MEAVTSYVEIALRWDYPGNQLANITTVSFFEPFLVQFYDETELLSLNWWFKLTVTKLNFTTNSLTTLFSVLVK